MTTGSSAVVQSPAVLKNDNGASKVGFKRPEAGAVATTIEVKAKEIFSARDFGVTGNGVTDDTAAMQAAINAAAGVKLIVPAGAHTLSAQLDLPNALPIKIVGEGVDSTTFKATALCNAVIASTVGGSAKGRELSGFSLNGNGFADYALEIEEGSNGKYSNLNLKGAKLVSGIFGPVVAAGETFNSNNFNAVEFNSEAVAAYSLHLRSSALDNFISSCNASNAVTACVLIEAGGNKLWDVRAFGANNPLAGFVIDGVDSELYGCRAGNIADVCFDIMRSNVSVIEAESRWDAPIINAYPVRVRAGLKNTRVTGRSVGGDNVQQVQFDDATPDRSNMVQMSQTIGSSSDPTVPSFLRMGEPLHDLLVGTFDTTLAGNNSDTSADDGAFLQAGALALAKYLGTALTLNRTGNNGRIISLSRSGTVVGYIDVTTGAVTLKAVGQLDLGCGAGSNIVIGDGFWNGQVARLGSYRLWVDGTGRLRIKSSNPTSDTDGSIVGLQS